MMNGFLKIVRVSSKLFFAPDDGFLSIEAALSSSSLMMVLLRLSSSLVVLLLFGGGMYLSDYLQ